MVYFGCVNTDEEKRVFHNLNVLEKATNKLIGDSIIVDSKIIELQSNDSILIGKIDKLLVCNEKIFILDKDVSKTIYVFNIDGTFSHKIGNIGKGPNEYLNPRDFIIKNLKDEIWVYDDIQKKIYSYNMEGEFITSFYLGLSFKSFTLYNNDTILCFTHGNFNSLESIGELPYDLIALNINDKDLSILSKQFYNNAQLNKSEPVFVFNNYFTKNKKDYFLHWIFNDTIYKIDNLYARPFLHL